jgi:alpha-beta hydrolase superfamily lysophospholipase
VINLATTARPALDGGRAAVPVSISLREQAGERLCLVEPADRRPKAQVVFVHGLSDHLGRQLRFLKWLAGEGYRGVSFELRAHGGQPSPWDDSRWVYDAYAAAERPREILARLAGAAAAERARAPQLATRQLEALQRTQVEDHLAQLSRTLELTRQLDPSLPIALVGHSMGALLGLEAVWRWSRRPELNLRGVALLSPALKPQARPGNPLEDVLVEAVWAQRRAPFGLARALAKAALGLNVGVDTTWGNRWISDLADEVALFDVDPLIPRRLPTRYASSIESLMVTTERRGVRLPLPALVMLPSKDGITSVRAGLDFARSVQLATGRDRVRIVQFAGLCAHDLLRSSARGRALAALGQWLEELLQGSRAGAGTIDSSPSSLSASAA